MFTRVAQQNVDGWNDTEGEETQLERGAMEKGKDGRYQRCIHPSFNRQTHHHLTRQRQHYVVWLAWSDSSTHRKNKKRSAFLEFSCFHKYLDTALVEIVLYFPCALAPFHVFENSTCCVCERKSLLEVKCGAMAQRCWFIAQWNSRAKWQCRSQLGDKVQLLTHSYSLLQTDEPYITPSSFLGLRFACSLCRVGWVQVRQMKYEIKRYTLLTAKQNFFFAWVECLYTQRFCTISY